MSDPTGIGGPLLERAQLGFDTAQTDMELAGILSGIGDVLYAYALLLERAGVSRDEIVTMLDQLIEQSDSPDVPEPGRGTVPRALTTLLLPRRPRLRLVKPQS